MSNFILGRVGRCVALLAVFVIAGCLDGSGGDERITANPQGPATGAPLTNQTPSGLAGCFVYALQKEAGGSRFLRIDLREGTVETIATYEEHLAALAIHPSDRVIYAVSDRSASSELYEIDAHSGDRTSLGQLEVRVLGLAFRPTDGVLWGSTPQGLVTIDPDTMETTLTGEVRGGAG